MRHFLVSHRTLIPYERKLPREQVYVLPRKMETKLYPVCDHLVQPTNDNFVHDEILYSPLTRFNISYGPYHILPYNRYTEWHTR